MEGVLCELYNYQCSQCGDIHLEDSNKVIDLNDDIYYKLVCPVCREVRKHLFVGQTIEDKYLLADPILDQRYYYNKTK